MVSRIHWSEYLNGGVGRVVSSRLVGMVVMGVVVVGNTVNRGVISMVRVVRMLRVLVLVLVLVRLLVVVLLRVLVLVTMAWRFRSLSGSVLSGLAVSR